MSEAVPAVSPELPSRTWRVLLAALGRLPQGALSRAFGAIADIPLPRPVRPAVLGTFARAFGIDVAEAEQPLAAYGSINQFFVRRLKAGARTWPSAPRTVASPVDAIVGEAGRIERGRLIQAKGRSYTAASLLADAADALRYDGGTFITLYLSPRHYHRIHAPVAGRIEKARHIPGRLLPVNAPAVAHIENLFAMNERLICCMNTAARRIAVVAVGAYNVGRITAAFDATISTNSAAASGETRTYEPPIDVARGAEIMAFHLGSTVVLLFEQPGVKLREDLVPGREVRLGEPIATCEEP